MPRYEQTCPCGASIDTTEHAQFGNFQREHNGEHALMLAAIKAGHYVYPQAKEKVNGKDA